MLSTSIPPKFPIPFANAAGPSFIRPIPTASQIGIQDGAASLTDGFPPDCFTPVVAGGTPPFGPGRERSPQSDDLVGSVVPGRWTDPV